MAGDFNTDLRRKDVFDNMDTRPKLSKLLMQGRKLPLNQGTSNKQRSSFQAQVSKIRVPDFAMKDFVLLSDDFDEPQISGFVNRNRRIPDRGHPSDHASRDGAAKKKRRLKIQHDVAAHARLHDDADAANPICRTAWLASALVHFVFQWGHARGLGAIAASMLRLLGWPCPALILPPHPKRHDSY